MTYFVQRSFCYFDSQEALCDSHSLCWCIGNLTKYFGVCTVCIKFNVKRSLHLLIFKKPSATDTRSVGVLKIQRNVSVYLHRMSMVYCSFIDFWCVRCFFGILEYWCVVHHYDGGIVNVWRTIDMPWACRGCVMELIYGIEFADVKVSYQWSTCIDLMTYCDLMDLWF
jgi:hypothetical protein